MEKKPRENNREPKTQPCGTPDTTLTSLHRQPTTITFCYPFDRNCDNIDKSKPAIPTEQILQRIPRWLTLSKATLESISTTQPDIPFSNALYSARDTHKSASQLQRPFRQPKWLVGSKPLTSINRSKPTDTRLSNTIDNTC